MIWQKEIKQKWVEKEGINERKEASKQNNEIPKKEIIMWMIDDNIEDFIKIENFINKLPLNIKSQLFFVLENISERDLIFYIENYGQLDSIDRIYDFLNKNIEVIQKYQNIEKIKSIFDWTSFERKTKIIQEKSEQERSKTKKITENKDNKSEKLKNTREYRILTLKSNIPKYENLFSWYDEIIKFVYELKRQEIQKDPDKIKYILNKIFSQKDKAIDFFQRLALSQDKELYQKTYQSIITISPELESKFKSWWIDNTLPEIDSVFWVPKKEVKKNWTKLSYQDLIFDSKTEKWFIKWKNWYKLEMDFWKIDITWIKLNYQKQRVHIFEELKELKNLEQNLKNILQDITWNWEDLWIFEKKEQLENKLNELKKQKTAPNKNAKDLIIDIQINLISKELEYIKSRIQKIKNMFNINTQENNFETKQKLITIITNFIYFNQEKQKTLTNKLQDINMRMQKEVSTALIWKYDYIKKQAERKRETLQFLDNIGFSLIPQSLSDILIYEINNSKELINNNLWWDKIYTDIDFLKWSFWWSETESFNKSKKTFLKLFNKIISWNPNKPISTEEIETIVDKKEYWKYWNNTKIIEIFEEYEIYNNWNFRLEKMIKNVKSKN